MQLTRYTDYSLRVLIYLAVRPEGLVRISDIAAAYDISRNHLMKVVHQLANRGYISTFRGNQGGMRLARRPQDIRIGEVVREMGEPLQIIDCGAQPCPILPACSLQRVLAEAQRNFLETLDRYSLADLVQGQEGALRRLLRLAQ